MPLANWVCLLSIVATPAAGETPAAGRPNIVLILADDLGAQDLACYGADLHETPHLDALARSGVRFTHAYSPSPVCSPTRAAIMTGKAPARLQITIWSEGSRQTLTNRPWLQAASRHDLPHSERTIATELQQAGYLTAVVGKWHLGDADHAPETHGFDVNIGGTRWGAPQTFFWPYRGQGRFGGEFRYVPHLEFGQPGEYLTDRLTDEALRVVDHAAASQRPFFLYLAHHAPHTPIEAKPATVRHFRERLKPEMKHQHPVYAAMIHSLDESIGRVIDRLRHHQLEQNTIVVFASDNGGYIGTANDEAGRSIPVTNNWPLRSGKGTCYEGGLRVPLIVHWPSGAQSGATCAEPVLLTDLYPTLRRAAGIPGDSTRPADGLDLGPLLKEPQQPLGRPALFFHYPHYYFAPNSTPVGAVRAGDWKLLEFFEDQHLELYNLREDPSETSDLAATQPQQAHSLRDQLHAWRQAVGAQMPQRNPNFHAPPRQE